MKKLFLLAGLMVCSTLSYASQLNEDISLLEQQTSSRIGVSVWDTQADERWDYRGDERFPLMSTFKTLACAKMLSDMDSGKLSKNATAKVDERSIVVWSPVMDKLAGQNTRIEHACEAAMLMSDNTAANLVLNEIGGPKAVTMFLRTIGDKATRLDRIEPRLNEATPGDSRDTTTPNAILNTLRTLVEGETLSYESRVQLKIWMLDNKVSDSLMRSVLPTGWSIADRSGAGGHGSRGINAIIWKENHRPVYISIYVTETELSLQARDQLVAQISQLILQKYKDN
ncbi:CARB family carbenicillin-hydrolyzing class A beta-lactamase [Vibrio alginolyticus]|uniref:CARB family carbenicillin-hydrolyzing class A beta-lactamase n=1 Tax=Vibrio alginolyticus TaxID=663 RepID=UPI0006A5956C|nr:CARB family carbenicillin-hydrolyzing class A beta-lactamase [Vibrio alginolyticus]EHK9545114.1 CARB family carbenicillin-hydrolyzing class A beta-lactamase [Vibrio alginolyticus]EHK9549577.1 CARB family carbenicillin-hydrolyzing class A beta-lactamase [Vibrio alginolyticus]EHK9602745.1 CARB family carbenicillin-hydrolyzing class A beta-lactamase [Vibrio alginolyticus]EHK9606437.1 CARB family carbenicillin-hydrolyzing class A beta-lactamase [Vibrio alginolyticus]KOF31692.1 beta-lactamase [V